MIFAKIESKEQVLADFKKMGHENAEIIFSFIKEAFEEYDTEQRELIEQEQKRQMLKDEFIRMAKENGLELEDIYQPPVVEEKQRKQIKPKYKITVDGVEHTWTGRGRKPAVFEGIDKAELEKKYLIKD